MFYSKFLGIYKHCLSHTLEGWNIPLRSFANNGRISFTRQINGLLLGGGDRFGGFPNLAPAKKWMKKWWSFCLENPLNMTQSKLWFLKPYSSQSKYSPTNALTVTQKSKRMIPLRMIYALSSRYLFNKYIYIYTHSVYLPSLYISVLYTSPGPHFLIPLFDLSHPTVYPPHPGEDSLGLGTVSTSVSASGWRSRPASSAFGTVFCWNHSIPGFPWEERGKIYPKLKKITYSLYQSTLEDFSFSRLVGYVWIC